MSFLNKLLFWKHDELDFDDLTNKEMQGMQPDFMAEKSPFDEHQEETPSAFPSSSLPPRSSPASLAPASFSRGAESRGTDLELINSKLDTIKAQLNAIEQRLAGLERNDEKKQRLW